MPFFNSEYSTLLQYFTLPLELVGLSLAAIEVRFPIIANRMNLVLADYFEHVRADDKIMQKAHPKIHRLLYFGPSFPAPKWPTITSFSLLLYMALAVPLLFLSTGLKALLHLQSLYGGCQLFAARHAMRPGSGFLSELKA